MHLCCSLLAARVYVDRSPTPHAYPPAHSLCDAPYPALQAHTPARVPATASRRLPDRAARSARKPVVDAATSSSESEEEEEVAEGDDALSPLGENQSPAVRRPSKARRQSSDSVSALRQALQENKIC